MQKELRNAVAAVLKMDFTFTVGAKKAKIEL
jgi:hypothetical protein